MELCSIGVAFLFAICFGLMGLNAAFLLSKDDDKFVREDIAQSVKPGRGKPPEAR
jgi:hypothetical protein